MKPGDLHRRAIVFGRIMAERDRQDGLWGQQDHGDLRWAAIFAEEGTEAVVRAVNNSLGDGEAVDMEREIVHALAVGCAWLECRMRHRLDAGEFVSVDHSVREAIASLPIRTSDPRG